MVFKVCTTSPAHMLVVTRVYKTYGGAETTRLIYRLKLKNEFKQNRLNQNGKPSSFCGLPLGFSGLPTVVLL
jgi:hypothetical protein